VDAIQASIEGRRLPPLPSPWCPSRRQQAQPVQNGLGRDNSPFERDPWLVQACGASSSGWTRNVKPASLPRCSRDSERIVRFWRSMSAFAGCHAKVGRASADVRRLVRWQVSPPWRAKSRVTHRGRLRQPTQTPGHRVAILCDSQGTRGVDSFRLKQRSPRHDTGASLKEERCAARD
jgi:hypothetical protein